MKIGILAHRAGRELISSAPPGVETSPEIEDVYLPQTVAEPGPEATQSVARRTGLSLMAALSMAGAVFGLAGCGGPAPVEPATSEVSLGTELSYLLMSTQDEVALGRQVAAQVEAEMPVWTDPVANERLQRLASDLVKDSARDDITYTFKLLDTPTVNAFAAPGGFIYVTRGLYENFRSDEELLFVMGHEMGHVEHRHTVKQMGKSLALEWAARLAAGDREGARIAAEIARSVLDNQFSQGDELESDRAGQQHLVNLGHNPWHAVRGMETLRDAVNSSEPEIVTEIFSSHPPSAERIEKLRQGAAGYPPL